MSLTQKVPQDRTSVVMVEVEAFLATSQAVATPVAGDTLEGS